MLFSGARPAPSGRVCSLGGRTEPGLSFEPTGRHESSCRGNDATARFSLVLSREDIGWEVSLLSWFHSWISGFLDFLRTIFLARSMLAVLLTDALVGTVHANLRFLSLQPSRSEVSSLSWLVLLSSLHTKR